MPNRKTSKVIQTPETSPQHKKLHALKAWVTQHHSGHSDIQAHVEFSGETEIIALTHGINHVAVADFIVMIVNAHNRQNKSLLLEAMEALELCLEEGDLTFASEQAADAVLTRYQRSRKRND